MAIEKGIYSAPKGIEEEIDIASDMMKTALLKL